MRATNRLSRQGSGRNWPRGPQLRQRRPLPGADPGDGRGDGSAVLGDELRQLKT
ncbi:hypothetical protein [Amycolatopsis sp.]|uniref:hypothetical protein n=1 Tax=Amycolatopsis sp. TaxID=37632 RepID=UPI0026245DD7|nr:hypothetical protein [Amycolatopsis sp.]